MLKKSSNYLISILSYSDVNTLRSFVKTLYTDICIYRHFNDMQSLILYSADIFCHAVSVYAIKGVITGESNKMYVYTVVI